MYSIMLQPVQTIQARSFPMLLPGLEGGGAHFTITMKQETLVIVTLENMLYEWNE